jgi:hypothetical protein
MAEDVVGELESKHVAQLASCCVVCVPFVLSPSGREGSSPVGENHMRAALSSYVKGRGVLCCRVGGRPDDPCSDPAIMAYLVPEQWQFEGRRAADGGDVF